MQFKFGIPYKRGQELAKQRKQEALVAPPEPKKKTYKGKKKAEA